MAKIFYSVAGEGRGHATRAQTMIDMLRLRHRITVFAAGSAHSMLGPRYADSEVKVVAIPGLRFRYTSAGRLDLLQTSQCGGRYIVQLPSLVRELEEEIESGSPDVVVTDFEPALPRAAKRCGVPFVSLDHQHFLVVSDLSALPLALQGHATLMGLVVDAYYRAQIATICSSFFTPPVKPTPHPNVAQVGVLLRPRLLETRPRLGRHLVAYCRYANALPILDALRWCGREIRVYGLGERPPEGNFRFHPISQQRFLEDLATCDGLISTAGNQLIGEALYLRKPVFAVPETRNYEQAINAWFLAESGTGMSVEMERLTADHVRRFLDELPRFRSRIRPDRVMGNRDALAAVERHLPGATAGPGTGADRRRRPERELAAV